MAKPPYSLTFPPVCEKFKINEICTLRWILWNQGTLVLLHLPSFPPCSSVRSKSGCFHMETEHRHTWHYPECQWRWLPKKWRFSGHSPHTQSSLQQTSQSCHIPEQTKNQWFNQHNCLKKWFFQKYSML